MPCLGAGSMPLRCRGRAGSVPGRCRGMGPRRDFSFFLLPELSNSHSPLSMPFCPISPSERARPAIRRVAEQRVSRKRSIRTAVSSPRWHRRARADLEACPHPASAFGSGRKDRPWPRDRLRSEVRWRPRQCLAKRSRAPRIQGSATQATELGRDPRRSRSAHRDAGMKRLAKLTSGRDMEELLNKRDTKTGETPLKVLLKSMCWFDEGADRVLGLLERMVVTDDPRTREEARLDGGVSRASYTSPTSRYCRGSLLPRETGNDRAFTCFP